MPSASQIYGGAYLTAADLGPLGQRRTAAIHEVTLETVGQEAKQMLALGLVSSRGAAWPKRVVLNKGNTMQLVTAYGDDYSGWPGKQIEIWAENVMFSGRLVPGIKVLPAPGQGAAMTPAARPSGNGATMQTATGPVGIPDDSPAVPAGKVWAGPGSDLDDEIPF